MDEESRRNPENLSEAMNEEKEESLSSGEPNKLEGKFDNGGNDQSLDSNLQDNPTTSSAVSPTDSDDSGLKKSNASQLTADCEASNSVSADSQNDKPPPEPVDIKVIYNKKKHDMTADLNQTILDLKKDIEKLTGVPIATQKVVYKGSTNDTQTLKDLKVTKNAKFMVIGSTMNDLLKVAAPDSKEAGAEKDSSSSSSSKEPLCKQTAHKKVLDKHGKPDDVTAGMKGAKLPLPTTPLSGMYNKYGNKTRLTFKLDHDELWIGTKERTQKVKMGSIKSVVSEAIEGHEDYHILGLQLGSTELSKYWIYWVPAQYVNAIKDTILGKWEFF